MESAEERHLHESFVMTNSTFATRWNLEAIEAMYRRWRGDPQAVDESWRWFFEGFELGNVQNLAAAPDSRAQIGVVRLIDAYRRLGHFVANLDPLSEPKTNHTDLALGEFGLH